MAETGFVKAQSDNLPNIDAFMLMEFMKNNDWCSAEEIRGVKAQLSMRDSYIDTAIGYVQVQRTDTQCIVLGQICPEHKIKAKNYKVKIVVSEDKENIDEVKCLDCAASEGGCKHALAFLMWAHKKSTQPAPTEVECYWKKPRLSDNKGVTTSDFGCVTTKTLNTSNFLQDSLNMAPTTSKCQLLKFFRPVDGPQILSIHFLLHSFFTTNLDSNQCFETFIKFCEQIMTDQFCKEAVEQTVCQSENKLWFELRYGRITASKIYSAAHCTKTDGTFVKSVIGASKIFQTKEMKRGLNLENKVREEISKNINIKIEQSGLVLNRKYPEFGASPDGVTKDAVIEIKCPSSPKTVTNYILQNGQISASSKAQIHLQMLMLNFKKGYFCVADPNFELNKQVNIIEITYDEEYFKETLEKAREFWKQALFPKLLETVR